MVGYFGISTSFSLQCLARIVISLSKHIFSEYNVMKTSLQNFLPFSLLDTYLNNITCSRYNSDVFCNVSLPPFFSSVLHLDYLKLNDLHAKKLQSSSKNKLITEFSQSPEKYASE